MSLHTYDEVEQGTEEWHALRRGIVTASTVGQLITTKTLKPADNDYSRALTAQLVADRIAGWDTEPNYVNNDMIRGTEEEPRARQHYAEHHTSEPVTECGFMIREEPGWKLGFSPDGLVGDAGLIEIKAPRAKTHIRTILSGEVPRQHIPQIQAGLLVSGREWCDFVSWCGGLPAWVVRVTPDLRWFQAIKEAAEQFEVTAEQMVKDFDQATEGLAQTERPLSLDEIVI